MEEEGDETLGEGVLGRPLFVLDGFLEGVVESTGDGDCGEEGTGLPVGAGNEIGKGLGLSNDCSPNGASVPTLLLLLGLGVVGTTLVDDGVWVGASDDGRSPKVG